MSLFIFRIFVFLRTVLFLVMWICSYVYVCISPASFTLRYGLLQLITPMGYHFENYNFHRTKQLKMRGSTHLPVLSWNNILGCIFDHTLPVFFHLIFKNSFWNQSTQAWQELPINIVSLVCVEYHKTTWHGNLRSLLPESTCSAWMVLL